MKAPFIAVALATILVITSFHEGADAATGRQNESLFDEPAATPTIELRPGPSVATTPLRANAVAAPTGNPLWSIPLGSLVATRDRPLFTPSRRPPAPAVANVPIARPAAPVAAPMVADRFALVLVGTIAGDTDGIAIFVDQDTKNVIRLRLGEAHAGWVLRSVRSREASLENAGRTETVALPKFQDISAASRLPDTAAARGTTIGR